jgi:hypothetical protein
MEGVVHTKRSPFQDFFLTGRAPKGAETALRRSGGFTNYIEDPGRKLICNMTLEFYKKDPTTIPKKVIRSLSTGRAELDVAATYAVAGDSTTWQRRGDEHHNAVRKDPPRWHFSLDEEEEMAPSKM